jgi:hypothetical protein
MIINVSINDKFFILYFYLNLTRSLSNIANINLKLTKSCRTSRTRLKISITRLIDFWIFALIVRFQSQRLSWSLSLSSRTRFWQNLIKRAIKSQERRYYYRQNVYHLQKKIIRWTNIAINLIIASKTITNEIVINSTKEKTIETINASEKMITTTTKNLIRNSMTRMTSTRFTSSSVLRF